MIRRTDAIENWFIFVGTRSASNPIKHRLYPALSNAEESNINALNFSDTGFQITDTNVAWNASGGTYIYMAFADTRDTAFWRDKSGTDNHWSLNAINYAASAGTTYDLMNDVPTLTSPDKGNFATLNPLNSAAAGSNNAATLSLSNLRATSSAAYQYGYSTIAIPEGTGKFIFEITFNTNTGNDNYNGGGLVIEGGSTGAYARTVNMGNAGVYGVRDYGSQFGQQYIQNGSGSGTITLPAGTNILFVVDRGANTLTFYKNGVLQTGTGSTVTIPSSGNLFPFTHGYSTNCDINFGQRPFAYTPPTGYKKLNTYNL